MTARPLLDRAACRGWVRVAASALLAAGALALPTAARADTTTGCATSAMSSADQPACWRPFSAASPFNSELPANPALAADSAAVQAHLATYGWTLDGANGGFTLTGQGTRPVYFASPSDPVVTVHCTDEDGPGTCRGTNGTEVDGARINLPAGAAPAANWDAHMTVIETATGAEYDFWHASISGSTLTAGAGSETDVAGAGTGSQGDAAYFALTAGLLRPAELAAGQIDHALVITVPCTNATGLNVGYTYPASAGWGEYCGQYWNESATGAPMLGQRFQLAMTDAQIAASGAPAWEQTIMTALAHYGAYIEDTNGSWRDEGMHIVTEDPSSWTNVGRPNQWAGVISALTGGHSTLTSSVPIPVSRLQLVNTCITQGTCPGATGPGPGGPGATGPGPGGPGATGPGGPSPTAPPASTQPTTPAVPATTTSAPADAPASSGSTPPAPPASTSSPAATDPVGPTATGGATGSARHWRHSRSHGLPRRSIRAGRRSRRASHHARRQAHARRARRDRAGSAAGRA